MECNDNEENYEINSLLKSDAFDCKKQKSQTSQPSTIQPLRKVSLVDILLKKIQPSLSERKWIIDQRQRQVSMEKPKIRSIRRKKERSRDISESRIRRSMKANFDKNDQDKQRSRERKRGEMSEREKKFMEKNKRKQTENCYENSKKVIKRKHKIYDSGYREDHDRHSVHSSDSEICLAGLTLIE